MTKEEVALLRQVAQDFAAAVPAVDRRLTHSRWDPGIGPFEEDNQLEALAEETDGSRTWSLNPEEAYPDNGQRCDLVVSEGEVTIPVEAKLARFRYDNGNIDPQSYARLFTPFPEETSSSLLTDAKKLTKSGFENSGGLLALYYEEENETYGRMNAENVAEKLAQDIGFWYEFDAEVAETAEFEGLRHPHHQRGAVITWALSP